MKQLLILFIMITIAFSGLSSRRFLYKAKVFVTPKKDATNQDNFINYFNDRKPVIQTSVKDGEFSVAVEQECEGNNCPTTCPILVNIGDGECNIEEKKLTKCLHNPANQPCVAYYNKMGKLQPNDVFPKEEFLQCYQTCKQEGTLTNFFSQYMYSCRNNCGTIALPEPQGKNQQVTKKSFLSCLASDCKHDGESTSFQQGQQQFQNCVNQSNQCELAMAEFNTQDTTSQMQYGYTACQFTCQVPSTAMYYDFAKFQSCQLGCLDEKPKPKSGENILMASLSLIICLLSIGYLI